MQLYLFDQPPKLELRKGHNAYQLTQQDKEKAEAERDEWKGKARKRFWALVACGVFAVL